MDLYGKNDESIPQKVIIHYPGNKDKIYTKGHLKYSGYINYFSNILWIIAFAILARNGFAIIIPIFLFFTFYNAPKRDNYLKNKYGEGYEEYADKTNELVLFIH